MRKQVPHYGIKSEIIPQEILESHALGVAHHLGTASNNVFQVQADIT
jgi:hypothetical protein